MHGAVGCSPFFPECSAAPGSLSPVGWWEGTKMAATGAVGSRLFLLLLVAAAAPSRARGSGCRSGAAVRGVSTH